MAVEFTPSSMIKPNGGFQPQADVDLARKCIKGTSVNALTSQLSRSQLATLAPIGPAQQAGAKQFEFERLGVTLHCMRRIAVLINQVVKGRRKLAIGVSLDDIGGI